MIDHHCNFERLCPRWGCMIRDLRHERGWSQDDLEKASGVKQGVIMRMEHGCHGLLTTYIRLFSALGYRIKVQSHKNAVPRYDERLGRLIYKIRREKGLNRPQLSKISGVKVQTIRTIEYMQRGGYMSNFERLFAALECDLDIYSVKQVPDEIYLV